MLLTVENYVGEETFRKGVHNYLAAHLYANATAEDFWNAQTADQPQACRQDHGEPGRPARCADPHFRQSRPTARSPSRRSVSSSAPASSRTPARNGRFPSASRTSLGNQDCAVLTPAASTLNVPASAALLRQRRRQRLLPQRLSTQLFQRRSRRACGIRASRPPSASASSETNGLRFAPTRLPSATIFDLVAAVKDDPNADVVSPPSAA